MRILKRFTSWANTGSIPRWRREGDNRPLWTRSTQAPGLRQVLPVDEVIQGKNHEEYRHQHQGPRYGEGSLVGGKLLVGDAGRHHKGAHLLVLGDFRPEEYRHHHHQN